MEHDFSMPNEDTQDDTQPSHTPHQSKKFNGSSKEKEVSSIPNQVDE